MEVDYAKLVQGWKHKKHRLEKSDIEIKELLCLSVKSIDVEKRQITACASAPTLDRDGDIIEVSAFKKYLPVYMLNPVILAAHQHHLSTGHSSVIGKTVKAWINKKGLWVVIEFVKGTALGEEYWLLYSQKMQSALSVGFKIHKSGYEMRDGKRVFILTEVELLEISCVPVPACPDALTLSAKNKKKKRFVQQKKRDAEEEKNIFAGCDAEEKKILAELMAEDPDFDKKAQDFADAMMTGDYDDIEENNFDDDLSGDNEKTARRFIEYKKLKDQGRSLEGFDGDEIIIFQEIEKRLAGQAKTTPTQSKPTLAKCISDENRKLKEAFGSVELFQRYLKYKDQAERGCRIRGVDAREEKLFSVVMTDGIKAAMEAVSEEFSVELDAGGYASLFKRS